MNKKAQVKATIIFACVLILVGVLVAVFIKASTPSFTIKEYTEYGLTENTIYLNISDNIGKDQTINISNIFESSPMTQGISYNQILMNQSYQKQLYENVDVSLGKWSHSNQSIDPNSTIINYYDSSDNLLCQKIDGIMKGCNYILHDKSIMATEYLNTKNITDYKFLPVSGVGKKSIKDSLKVTQKQEGIYLPKYGTIQLKLTYSHPLAFGRNPDYEINKYNITVSSQYGESTLDPTWWNSSWTAYKPISAYISSGSQTNYPLMVNVSYDSSMNPDFSDLRFISTDNSTELNYWVDPDLTVNSSSAIVYLNTTLINTTNMVVAYMYFGNSGASSSSNGTNVFDLFDDFNRADSATVGNGWYEGNDGLYGIANITDGRLRFTHNSSSGGTVYINHTIPSSALQGAYSIESPTMQTSGTSFLLFSTDYTVNFQGFRSGNGLYYYNGTFTNVYNSSNSTYYDVAFRNINYTSHKYDIYIGGSIVKSSAEFANLLSSSSSLWLSLDTTSNLVGNVNWVWTSSKYDSSLSYSFGSRQSMDSLAPNVTLVSPSNNTKANNLTQIFSINATDDFSLKNATLYVWNSTDGVNAKWCYQESANTTNQSTNYFQLDQNIPLVGKDTPDCGLQYTGTYTMSGFTASGVDTITGGNNSILCSGYDCPSNDGNWLTSSIGNTIGYYVNYTKPTQYLISAEWIVRDYFNLNFSWELPISCLSYNNSLIQLKINATTAGSNAVNHYYCYDGIWNHLGDGISYSALGLEFVSEEAMNWYVLNSTQYKSISGTSNQTNFTYTLPSDGDYKWNAYVCDTSGNCAFNSTNYTFSIDTTYPAFTTIPSNATITYPSIWNGADFNASDTHLSSYYINDTSNFTINSTGYLNATGRLGAGAYILTVSANDTYGNVVSTTFKLTIDRGALTGSLTSSKGFSYTYDNTATTISYTGTVSTGASDVAYKIYRDSVDKGTGESPNLAVGSYAYKLNSTGGANWSSSYLGFCYQESADLLNQSGIDGNCGLAHNGSYAGLWNSTEGITDGSDFTSGGIYYYVNYTKPAGALSTSLWNVYDSSNLYNNLSISSACWNYNSSKILLSGEGISTSGLYAVAWSCYNGTGWSLLGSSNAGNSLQSYQEAMWWNISSYIDNQTLTISKATPTGSISGTSPIVYKTAGNVQGTESNAVDSDVTYSLYRNGTLVSNPDTSILGVNTYHYVYNTTGGTNFTSSSSLDTFDLTVTQNPEVVYTKFNTTSPKTFPYQFKVYSNATSTFTIYRNGTTVSNNSVQTLGAGVWNFTTIRTDKSNYSNVTATSYFTISKSSDSCGIFINVSSPITYGQMVNVQTNCTTAYSMFLDNSPITNNTNYLSDVGSHNFSVFRTDQQNYSNIYSEVDLTINKAVPSLSLSITNATYPSNGTINASESNSGDIDLTYNLYINGVLQTSGSSITNYNKSLGAGVYVIVYNTSGGINYNATSTSLNMTISQGTPTASLTNNKAWSRSWDATNNTIGISESNIGDSDVAYVLWRDGANVGTSENISAVGVYAYKINTTGGANWTSADNMDTNTLNISDLVSPNVTLYAPSNYTFGGTIQTFNLSAYDNYLISNVSIYFDDSLNQTNSSGLNNTNYTFTISGISSSDHNWTIQVCDSSNNCINSSTWILRVDTTAPVVSLTSPADSYTTIANYLTFIGTASDNVQLSNVSVYLDGAIESTNSSGINASSYSFLVSGIASGIHTWLFRACDNFNNCANSTSRTFTSDSSLPVITLNYPSDNSGVNNSYIVFNGTVSDNVNLTSVAFYVDSILRTTNTSGINNSDYLFPVVLSDANHTWSYYACDSSSNCILSTPRIVTVDTIFPNINITNVYTNINSQTFSFDSDETDTNLNKCWYNLYNSSNGIDGLNSGKIFSCNTLVSVSATLFGTYTLNVNVNDTAGNTNSTNQSVTLNSSSIVVTTGGGGTTVITQATNFSVLSYVLTNSIDLSLAKGSVVPRERDFIVRNDGVNSINVKLTCVPSNSTGDINICDYVTFKYDTLTVPANVNSPVPDVVYVQTPENAQFGDSYYFTIRAISDSNEFSQLSASSTVSVLSLLYKWSYIPPISVLGISENSKAVPVSWVGIGLGIIVFLAILIPFSRAKAPATGFLIGLTAGLIVFILSLIFL